MTAARWFDTVDREAVFEVMRTIGAEELDHDRAARALQPRHGELAVGPGAFDRFVLAEVRRAFLDALRKGDDPDHAGDAAKAAARVAVAAHNDLRPRDVHWRRWDGTADLAVDDLVRRVRRAVFVAVEYASGGPAPVIPYDLVDPFDGGPLVTT